MGLLDLLGGGRSSTESESGDTRTVRRIVRELDELPPERARFIACFAYLLSRVANADLEISEEETAKMEQVVREVGGMPAEQALLVVEIAKAQNRLFGGTENFQVARELKRVAAKDDMEHLLHCLFAVSAADSSISTQEEHQTRQIAEELGFSHAEYIAVRARYNDQRSVIQRLGGKD